MTFLAYILSVGPPANFMFSFRFANCLRSELIGIPLVKFFWIWLYTIFSKIKVINKFLEFMNDPKVSGND